MLNAAILLPRRARNCAGPPHGGSARVTRAVLGSLLLSTAATPVWAQTVDPMDTQIVVIGERPMSLPSQRTIEGDDLDAYGAATIGELVEEVSAQGGENSPVTILVNGRRVTGMADIESYPAEAIERVEILPREGGTAVGAPPGQRVFNIVLKPETRVGTIRGRARAATEGGTAGIVADLGGTRIRQPQRINLALQLSRQGALLESERPVIQALSAPPGSAEARTLSPLRNGFELSLSGADQILPWLDALATVKLRRTRTEALLGLSSEGQPIARETAARTLDLSAQLAAQRGAWLLTLDGASRFDDRRSATGPARSGDNSTSRTRANEINLLATGPLVRLPAGPVQMTLGASLRHDSVVIARSAGGNSRFSRTSRNFRAGIDLPLIGDTGPLPWLRNVTVRAEASRGTSGTSAVSANSASLRWVPTPWLQVTGLVSDVATAAGIDLMNEPILETPGVRYFDPIRAETVEVVAVSGGRTDLPRQEVKNRSLTIDLRPLRAADLLLTAEYSATRNTNVVSVLPQASALVIALFPDRFVRDGTGRLTRVDLRPVVFPSQREEQLRASINLGLPLGQSPRRPRLQLNASLRYLLGSTLVTPDGETAIDLLGRSGIALGGAMRPRLRADFTLGYAERGLGLRLTGERRGVSFLGAAQGPDLLTFAPLTTINLRAFVDGQRFAPSSSFLRRSRVSVEVGNLTNRREQVRDGQQATPLAFQPILRDPVGRTLELDFRVTF